MANPIDPSEFGVTGREEVAATLPRLAMLKAQAKEIAREVDAIERDLKIELTNDPDPILFEGYVALLKERNKPASIDLGSLAATPDGERYLGEAARAGVLNALLTPLRALAGRNAWADGLLKFEMPNGVNQILEVTEPK